MGISAAATYCCYDGRDSDLGRRLRRAGKASEQLTNEALEEGTRYWGCSRCLVWQLVIVRTATGLPLLVLLLPRRDRGSAAQS